MKIIRYIWFGYKELAARRTDKTEKTVIMVKKSNVEVKYAKIPDDIESIKKLWFDYLV